MSSWGSTALYVLGALTFLRWSVWLLHELQRAIRVHLLPRLRPKRFKEQYGEWAVVTGASDGIGKGYARELASAGMKIILIARNKDKLDKVAQEINSEFGVETMVIVADYSQGRSIYSSIEQQLQGKDIGILVNNVGVFTPTLPATFGNEEIGMDDIWKSVNINVASVPTMTKIILPGMLAKGRGAIVNMGSMFSMSPIPMGALYTSSKAYVDFFTQALAEECRGTGVVVQGVHPGFVKTNMTDPMGESLEIPLSGVMFPKVDNFCACAVATLGHTDYTTGYWGHGIFVALLKLLPSSFLVSSTMKNNMEARERKLNKKYN